MSSWSACPDWQLDTISAPGNKKSAQGQRHYRRTLIACSITAELPNDYQSLLVVVVVVVVAVMPNDYHMVVVVVVAVMPIRLLRKSADGEEHK
jgi:hypothetical protein